MIDDRQIDRRSVGIVQPGTASRRLVWKLKDLQLMTIPNFEDFDQIKILRWVEEHTSGQFYLAGNKIAFVDERDTLIFKLGFKF